MKYISLDPETTGLQRKTADSILMISLIVEDTQKKMPLASLPHYTAIIDHGASNFVYGEPYALGMNGWIFKIMTGQSPGPGHCKLVPASRVWEEVAVFVKSHFPNQKPHLAGANVGSFDLQFLPPEIQALFRHRTIEVGSVFADFQKGEVPSFDTVKRLTGVPGPVSHDAYQDALDVIAALRSKY